MRCNAGLSLCLALLLTMAGQAVAAAEPQIVWQVENPFRFFLDPADTGLHRATWASLSETERRHPVMSAERVLAERHSDGWSATTFLKTCWDPQRNRYSCRERGDYLAPKSHTVLTRLEGLDDAQTVDCTWLTSPQGRGPRGKAVTLPCDTPVQLDVPYPSGAWISVEIGGRRVAEVAAQVADLFIVGMGDSFASGEGNPDVPVRFSPDRTTDYGLGTNNTPLTGYPARLGDWKAIGDRQFIEENARWQDQACHRSLYSHQMRAALQLAVEDEHRAVTFVGVACSGAETTFGLFLDYKGNEWVPHPPDLPQISAVAEAQCGGKGAPDYDLPEAYHINNKIPELKGGLVLKKCDADRARKIDLLLLSIGGAWLAKHEGFWVLRRLREQLDAGRMPTNELIDAGLVLAGAVLLIFPGFVTDAFGLLLLFPPTRVLARTLLKRRFHVQVYGPPSNRGDGRPPPPPPGVIDV